MNLPAPDTDAEGLERARIARLRRRRLWLLGGGFGALALAAMATVFFGDASPPDVSDLDFVPVNVAYEENLYVALAKLGAELKAKPVIEHNEADDAGPPIGEMDMSVGLPDDSWTLLSPADTLRERLLRGQSWTPERIAKWRPGLDAVVAEAEKLSRLTRAQGTVLEPNTSSYEGCWDINEALLYLKLAARASQVEGRLDEAIHIAGMGWRLARAVRDSRGYLADYTLGGAAMAAFERLFCELASIPDADADLLRKLQSLLREEVSGRDGFVDSVKNEFCFIQKALALYTAADAARPGLARPGCQGKEPGLLARCRVFFPLMYKLNYTTALYADRTRCEIKAADLTPDKYREMVPDWECAACQSSALHASLHLWNKEGRSLLSDWAPSSESRWLHVARAMNFSRHSVAETVVALRLYHLEHGTLPARLADLVPTYLPVLPLDYLDRQPIRYSREFRTVWSIGEKKLTIAAADQEIAKGEVFYRLDFAAPAEATEERTRLPRLDRANDASR